MDQLSILGRLGAYYGEGKLSSNFGAGGNKEDDQCYLRPWSAVRLHQEFRGAWRMAALLEDQDRDDTTGIEGESDVDCSAPASSIASSSRFQVK